MENTCKTGRKGFRQKALAGILAAGLTFGPAGEALADDKIPYKPLSEPAPRIYQLDEAPSLQLTGFSFLDKAEREDIRPYKPVLAGQKPDFKPESAQNAPDKSAVQEKAKLKPRRDIKIRIADPKEDMAVGSELVYSAEQVIGLFSDSLSKYTDRNKATRFLNLVPHVYKSFWLGLGTHEYNGHYRIGKKNFDDRFLFSVRLADPIDLNKNFTLYTKYSESERDKFLEVVTAGLVANEHYAYTIWNNSWDNGNNLTFDNAISFMVSHLWDLIYVVFNGDGDQNDMTHYIKNLRKKGINITKEEYLWQTVLSDGLSMYFWDSLKGIFYDYVYNGQRVSRPTSIKIRDVEVSPPLFAIYPTKDGSLLKADVNANCSGKPRLKMSLAGGVGSQKIGRIRIGGEYTFNDVVLPGTSQPFDLALSGYLNLDDSSLEPRGSSLGAYAETDILKNKRLKAGIGVRYDQDDVFYNKALVEENGLKVYGTLKARF